MNEEQHKNAGRAKLSTKTKIAVWWLLIFGSIGIISAIVLICGFGVMGLGVGLAVFLFAIFYLIIALLLVRGERFWAVLILLNPLGWWVLFLLLNIGTYDNVWEPFSSFYPYILIFLLFLIPLILIILDRKNTQK